MAEKEETITVAVRLPASQVKVLRGLIETHQARNMSEALRAIVSDWTSAWNNLHQIDVEKYRA